MALNCWEVKRCGREPGGSHVKELGICPAATLKKAAGINRGDFGGRACWVIGGTLCGGKVQGTFASKMADCMTCDFYVKVKAEEGRAFAMASDILKVLQ